MSPHATCLECSTDEHPVTWIIPHALHSAAHDMKLQTVTLYMTVLGECKTLRGEPKQVQTACVYFE